VHAVGAARLDQVGAVVEDEQRAVAAEGLGGVHQPVVVERLVAQLDQIDAAANRGRDPVAVPRRAHEIETGS